MRRLYIVVRSDLDPGAQIAQAVHAATAFACAHASCCRAWQATDNNVVVLAASDLEHLDRLRMKIAELVDRRVAIHEPDLGWQLTAIAFEGIPQAARVVSSLPLALRPPKIASASAA